MLVVRALVASFMFSKCGCPGSRIETAAGASRAGKSPPSAKFRVIAESVTALLPQRYSFVTRKPLDSWEPQFPDGRPAGTKMYGHTTCTD